MYTIYQSNLESAGQVKVYADSFIITEDGNVIYASMFGTSAAMKSISAQIIENKFGILICDNETGNLFNNKAGYPLHLTKGNERMRTITKNLKPGVVHRILYSESFFVPRSAQGDEKFLAYGETDEEAITRAFRIVDKLSEIPLKDTWKHWLFNMLMEPDYSFDPLIVGGLDHAPQFKRCRLFVKPPESYLEEQIRENLSELKAA
jgi:hypothetical protein